MNLFNIVYIIRGERYVDQVYANGMLEACAIAHLKHGEKVVSVGRV